MKHSVRTAPRALVLAVALLVSSLAPTLVLALPSDDEGAMACCARDRHCGLAWERACCPCSPGAPSTSPTQSASAPLPTVAVSVPVADLVAAYPRPASELLRLWCEQARRHASPDPPWLLHGVFLI